MSESIFEYNNLSEADQHGAYAQMQAALNANLAREAEQGLHWNAGINGLQSIAYLQANDPLLARRHRRQRADEVTGVIYDDTQ